MELSHEVKKQFVFCQQRKSMVDFYFFLGRVKVVKVFLFDDIHGISALKPPDSLLAGWHLYHAILQPNLGEFQNKDGGSPIMLPVSFNAHK